MAEIKETDREQERDREIVQQERDRERDRQTEREYKPAPITGFPTSQKNFFIFDYLYECIHAS